MLITAYSLLLAVVAYGTVIYTGIAIEELVERYKNNK
jgi:hypothetical protein